ncbi:MAG: hypothetical protein AVDCRST_MAG13-546, partial [uncultured Solirubrobacteraceae bacterium]
CSSPAWASSCIRRATSTGRSAPSARG